MWIAKFTNIKVIVIKPTNSPSSNSADKNIQLFSKISKTVYLTGERLWKIITGPNKSFRSVANNSDHCRTKTSCLISLVDIKIASDLYKIHSSQRNFEENIYGFRVSIVSPDGLAPSGARPSAGTMLIMFESDIHTGPAPEVSRTLVGCLPRKFICHYLVLTGQTSVNRSLPCKIKALWC